MFSFLKTGELETPSVTYLAVLTYDVVQSII